MTIEALVLDVGGVLVESPFVAAVRWGTRLDLPMEAFASLYDEYSRVAAPGEEPPLWHRVECGQAPLAAFVDTMRDRFAEVLPPDHPASTLQASDFNPFADATSHPQMAALASEARSAGLQVAILTNNVREWSGWRTRVPLEHFHHVIDSCEVGLRKPDPAIYALVESHVDVSGDRILFLDDHQGNVDAAVAVGWQAQLVGTDISEAVMAARTELGLGA